MAQSTLRTDQVGSLIRPTQLLAARDSLKAGKLSREELRKVEDEAILEALALQRQLGMEVFTDGEMRRDSFMTNVSAAVEGFEESHPVNEQRKPDGTAVLVEAHQKTVVGKLRAKHRIAADEAAFLRQHSPGRFKITLISPARLTPFRPGRTDKAYATPYAMRDDLVAIVRDEMKALAAEGVTYIQLDEGLAEYVRDGWREQQKQVGKDPDKELAATIAAENLCWDALPDSITKATHICRGNRTAWGGGRGGYDWVAEQAFNSLHVDRYLLEYDTDRAGGFEPLRFVPKGKTVVLGLISTKNPRLEGEDELLRRIEEAAKYCPVDQLALSPQCGFQSAANPDGAFMTMDDEKRKLELMLNTARKVWS